MDNKFKELLYGDLLSELVYKDNPFLVQHWKTILKRWGWYE